MPIAPALHELGHEIGEHTHFGRDSSAMRKYDGDRRPLSDPLFQDELQAPVGQIRRHQRVVCLCNAEATQCGGNGGLRRVECQSGRHAQAPALAIPCECPIGSSARVRMHIADTAVLQQIFRPAGRSRLGKVFGRSTSDESR